MIVKIGENFYDSTQEPVLLILGEHEKKCIANMEEQKKFCSFPQDSNVEEIKKFMKVSDDIIERVNYKEE